MTERSPTSPPKKSHCVALESMDNATCVHKLAQHHLGRLAVIVDDAPMVVPVNYAWLDDAIVFSSDDGTKARALTHGSVAFQIDEVDPLMHTGWSVLVVGRAESGVEIDESHVAVAPWCGAGKDARWVRLVPDRISGRRIVLTKSP